MVTGDFWVLLAMLLYFIVVVLIGFVYAKKSNASSEAYFLGGRGLGPWLTALSAEASDMSGWVLMGLPGVAYFTGASDAMWTAIGLAIGTYLNWKFVAKRLRKYSEVANNSITVPDFFSNRFHDNKHVLMTIAAIITLVFFSIYTGSCFVTCANTASAFGTYSLSRASACASSLHVRRRISLRLHDRPYPGHAHVLRTCHGVHRQRRAGGRR